MNLWCADTRVSVSHNDLENDVWSGYLPSRAVMNTVPSSVSAAEDMICLIILHNVCTAPLLRMCFFESGLLAKKK